MWLTVLLALVPLAALLFLLAIVRLTAWLAALIAGGVALTLGAALWHAPWGGMLRSYSYGALSGAWVIDWITFWGLVIFNTPGRDRRLRPFQSMDGAPRHRRHSRPNHHAGLGFRRAPRRISGLWLSLGRGSAYPRRPRHRRSGSHPDCRPGQQRSCFLWRAGCAHPRPFGGDFAARHGALRLGGKYCGRARAATPLGADLPGQRLEGRARGLALGAGRLLLLHRRTVAGGALSRPVPA